LNEFLQTALRAASAGAAVVAEAHRRRDFTVTEKSRADYVTSVDVAAQHAVTDVLRARHPDHVILAEEGSGEEAPEDAELRWVVDPLDGTTNFVRGIEFFSVAVGLERRGVPVVGVIVDPVRGDTWHAVRGGGAFKNGERARVSRASALSGVLALTGIPFRELKWLREYLAGMERVARECAGIRRMGSAALDLASIADGRAEVFWEYGLSRWDLTAGVVLVEEAGGTVTDLDGGTTHLATGHSLASNGLVHEAFLECLRGG
jgi:myo-inositol-1(or 4)-monophosphatase